MKVADYVAGFLRDLGIRHVFAIAGGASIHMIHAIARADGIECIYPQHEQAAAMMADAYSRVTDRIGCAIATSGPGATNLLTGIAAAYFDSIPVLYITGQVTTGRLRGDSGVRQLGFQETDIVSMAKPITKYAVMVEDAGSVDMELAKAVKIAREGRPGPVLVDIPDDIQRAEMGTHTLFRGWHDHWPKLDPKMRAHIEGIVPLLQKAKRPVFIPGAGARCAPEWKMLAEKLGFAICPTWAMLDQFPADHPLLAGAFGTNGTRAGNFTVANADLILAVGARLGTRETGTPVNSFAREAKIIAVDCDDTELRKFERAGRPIDVPICTDARCFVPALYRFIDPLPERKEWLGLVASWRQRYRVSDKPLGGVGPYHFVEALSDALAEGDRIFCDTGNAISWMTQGFKFKVGQRLFHAFNQTPMGWSLPAAIGGSFARAGRVVCVCGDSSMLMNVQEMLTAAKHKLPIKLFLLNNSGQAMCQQTEEEWLGGVHCGTTPESGLAYPESWWQLANAMGWRAGVAAMGDDLERQIRVTLETDGPVFCEVRIPASARAWPKSRYGYPIEDAEPLLARDEFRRNMIVEPWEASR